MPPSAAQLAASRARASASRPPTPSPRPAPTRPLTAPAPGPANYAAGLTSGQQSIPSAGTYRGAPIAVEAPGGTNTGGARVPASGNNPNAVPGAGRQLPGQAPAPAARSTPYAQTPRVNGWIPTAQASTNVTSRNLGQTTTHVTSPTAGGRVHIGYDSRGQPLYGGGQDTRRRRGRQPKMSGSVGVGAATPLPTGTEAATTATGTTPAARTSTWQNPLQNRMDFYTRRAPAAGAATAATGATGATGAPATTPTGGTLGSQLGGTQTTPAAGTADARNARIQQLMDRLNRAQGRAGAGTVRAMGAAAPATNLATDPYARTERAAAPNVFAAMNQNSGAQTQMAANTQQQSATSQLPPGVDPSESHPEIPGFDQWLSDFRSGTYNPASDVNGDGKVSIVDYNILLTRYRNNDPTFGTPGSAQQIPTEPSTRGQEPPPAESDVPNPSVIPGYDQWLSDFQSGTYNPASDIDGDGQITVIDYAQLLNRYRQSQQTPVTPVDPGTPYGNDNQETGVPAPATNPYAALAPYYAGQGATSAPAPTPAPTPSTNVFAAPAPTETGFNPWGYGGNPNGYAWGTTPQATPATPNLPGSQFYGQTGGGMQTPYPQRYGGYGQPATYDPVGNMYTGSVYNGEASGTPFSTGAQGQSNVPWWQQVAGQGQDVGAGSDIGVGNTGARWLGAKEAVPDGEWAYDTRQGWQSPIGAGQAKSRARPGVRVAMGQNFDPRGRQKGYYLLISPPGVAAPTSRFNYTPQTKEGSMAGAPAPIDQANITLLSPDDLAGLR